MTGVCESGANNILRRLFLLVERMIGQVSKEYMAEPLIDWILAGIPNPPNVKLFDDVGLIYEAQLAKMELAAWWHDLKAFRTRAAYYEEIENQKTHHYFISDIRGKDQIGRSNQYLTHGFYPYKAKYHPQMIKAMINWMGLKKGETVLDPFAGSGTTLVEAKLVGVNGIGIDVDPLCILLSKVKTDLLELAVSEMVQVSLKDAYEYFHHIRPDASANLERYLTGESRDVITDRGIFRNIDQRVYDFYLLSYLCALSDYTYVQADMWERFQLNARSMTANIRKFEGIKTTLPFEFGSSRMIHGDARLITDYVHESVDGIVTSPPYSIAIDYIGQDLHALKYLSINPEILRGSLVGLRGEGDERIKLYYDDMTRVFRQMHAVLKSGKQCVIVIGDVTYNGYKLSLSNTLVKLAKDAGFQYTGVIRRPILGGFAKLRYEYILFFQKPQ